MRPAVIAAAIGIAAGGCGGAQAPPHAAIVVATRDAAIWKCDCKHPQARWLAVADLHPTCPCGPRCGGDHGPLATFPVRVLADAALATGPAAVTLELEVQAPPGRAAPR